MPINDTDRLLVNNGTATETITFAHLQDGTVLNDSDKFLINDGTKTETVTWAEIEEELGPKDVNTPIVLKPLMVRAQATHGLKRTPSQPLMAVAFTPVKPTRFKVLKLVWITF